MTTFPVVADGCVVPAARDAGWQASARWARRLAWVSLAAVLLEGVVGLWQGLAVGSIALTGWALGGAAEALASAMVVWRFTGTRVFSDTAEQRAQRGVALSFWLTAPYIAAESIRDLTEEHHAGTSMVGIGLTTFALVLMPVLGWANHTVGERLDSGATEGEGIQNYLCGAQAAGVLSGLAVTGLWPGGWWIDPAIGLVISGIAVWEGVRAWRGHDCCC
jgi:divalent metal cation (Fe/Co/Zn/Cd) transporter